MKIKILTICFSILFFGITNVYCQIFATPFSDEDQIKILLKDIINSVNNDRPIKVENYFINQSKKSGLQLDTNIIRQYIRSPIELKIYSINIEEETAKASCYLISPYIIDPIKDNLLLQKINGQWTIISSEYLYSLCKIFQEKRNTPQSISNDNQDLYKSNSVNIRYSNKLLIPKKVPGTNKKKLTESDIISYIGKSLFAHPIDIEYASYEENNGNKTFVGFCLDRNWNRIIIQKIITDNNNNILNSQLISYGDNVNEYKFYGPQGLSYAECGEIYIADTDNDKIVKLLFDRHTLTLTLSQTKEIEGIYFPTDVVYDNNNTPQLEDDFIWITDPNAAKIVRLDRQFNILQTITSYIDDYGNNSQLDMPKKIMVNNIHASYQKRLAYINSNTFVELIPGNSPPFFNSVFYWSIKKFQTPSNLSSIGLEWPEGWLLLDEGRNCLHKINKWGDYIASFKSNLTTGSLFTFPKFISSSGVNIHASDTIKYLDIGAIDVWGLSTGFQNFLPGADVLDFKVKEYPASFVIEYTPTNWIKDSLKVLKKSDRTVVKEWPLWNTPPEKETESIMKSEIWYGNYIVRLTYRPLGDSEYGDYMQGWTAIEIPLTYLLPTTISNGQIYWGQTSTITANTFGQNSLTYSWTTEPNPVPAGTNFFVDNLYPYKAYLKNIRYSPYLLKVPMFGICIILTVSNSLGTHSITDFIGLIPGSSGGGGGCPFVYTWNGSEYIEDNNILPQSVYAPPDEGLVTDYYQLFTEPVETDRTYKLRVGEFEQEISTLDQFKLLIVDHIPEAMVSANDIGEISLYAKPASLTNANVDDGDVYKLVYEIDDNYVETEPDQSMQLTFEDGQVGSDKVMLLQASSDLKVPFGALEKLNGKNINPQDIKARKNMSYVWVPVDVQNHKETNIDIGIAWTGTAKLDYIELSNKLNLDYTLHESELISAEHSQDGDVTSLLQNSDGNIVELKPQEWVDLVFTAPPLSEGMKRSFIFVSCGRYVTIPEDKKETQTLSQKGGINENVRTVKLPVSYELFDNHPNPFNPITKISYTIPEPNFVSLKIFDVLGREIATLVAEYQDAGYKTVEFSGVSTNGGLPSGVYFYKLQAGSFISVKKMLLAK